MLGPIEQQVVPSAQLLAGLAQLFAAGGPFHTLTLQLYQNAFNPTRLAVYTDFVIADFSGYADVAGVVFDGPFYDSDGSALMMGSDNAFIATAATPFVPNVIFGYLLANAGLTDLAVAYHFDDSVGVSAPGRAVLVAPFVRYSGN